MSMYVSLFASITAIVSLMLTSDRKSSRCCIPKIKFFVCVHFALEALVSLNVYYVVNTKSCHILGLCPARIFAKMQACMLTLPCATHKTVTID